MNKDYTIKKEYGDYVATSTKYPNIIGVGETKEKAISEMYIFVKQYEEYKLSPLEALNKIAYAYGYDENIKIIATALKDYELMKQTKVIVADKKISDNDLEKLKNQRMYVGSLERCEVKPLLDEETKKKLKALEIIKEKNVDVVIIRLAPSCKSYNKVKTDVSLDLNENEFKLVKEVLR